MKSKPIDKKFLMSVVLLVSAGVLIFWSASLGLLARDSVTYGSIAFKQIFLGLIPGVVIAYFLSRINFEVWHKYSFYIFILAILLNILIFVPGFGLDHGGATRWLKIGSYSLQTSEFLKIASVLCFGAWLSAGKSRLNEWKFGLLPLVIMLGILGGLLLTQPDTDTFIVIAVSLVAMYLVAGGRWRDIVFLAFLGVIGIGALAFTRPYVMSRITTFIHPAENSLGSSYQIQQSLIAIGSGGIVGRGFGQSIQKFGLLPEPVGDSIFAVAGEEFGFIGLVTLIAIFLFFSLRAMKIALNAPTPFSSFIIVGFITYMIVESFINMGAMTGILPLSGIPLLFVSQGGTALLFALAAVGIMMNISRSAKR